MSSAALLLVAPTSLAFAGRFVRGPTAARRHHLFVAASNSCRASWMTAIRGGDQTAKTSLYSSSSPSTTCNELSNLPIPPTFDERKDDVRVAIMSVLAASRVTRHVQPTSTSTSIETISKKDASPVTVGDFASQALALKILHDEYPCDMYIAEEGSEALQNDESLLDTVWDAVNHVHEGLMSSKEQLMHAIDYGQGIDDDERNNNEDQQSTTVKRKVWCLDPIDGTKGFLRGRIEGGQYCIALALIEDGEPVISVLGCPNLPLPLPSNTPATETVPYGLWSEEEVEDAEQSQTMFSQSRGCLFVAVLGNGCYEVPLHLIEKCARGHELSDEEAASMWTRLHVTPNCGTAKSITQSTFCLGVERGFSDPKGTVLKIAQMIHGPDSLITDSDGIQDIKNSMRLDGQGKYGLLARGDAEYFLRLPKAGYIDWVWDVAAGYLVLKEGGGTMTDVHGRSIDFSEIGLERKAKLPDHVKGILGSCGGMFHEALVDAHAKVEQM